MRGNAEGQLNRASPIAWSCCKLAATTNMDANEISS